ncbi:dipeptidase PepE [Thalassotalea sediminis]|uniref:dipeptidase PepE n=1 Tax=Thalassotalea sediminis TaxID=1759089 RepID=UPI00257382CE|nr:dipeptidase PepE [Thalassotalea sediminis]
MNKRNLLLLSSSKVANTPYLSHALPMIKQQLKETTSVIFVPYAGVGFTYQAYTEKVNQALLPLNIQAKSLDQFSDKKSAILNTDAIIVGGGNTFTLLDKLYHYDLIDTIKYAINENAVKYIGWSAGANIAGSSIKTTNDMPIVQPPSFKALGLVNCQLNPHYSEYIPPGFNGETREQRLNEFMVVAPETLVIGLVEGSALKVIGNKYQYLSSEGIEEPMYLFKGGVKQKVTNIPEAEII